MRISPEDFYQSMVEGHCKRPRMWVSSPECPNYESRKLEITPKVCAALLIDRMRLKAFAMKLVAPMLRGVEFFVTIECGCGNRTQIKL